MEINFEDELDKKIREKKKQIQDLEIELERLQKDKEAKERETWKGYWDQQDFISQRQPNYGYPLDQPCLIEEYFKQHPNENFVHLSCNCPRCTVWC